MVEMLADGGDCERTDKSNYSRICIVFIQIMKEIAVLRTHNIIECVRVVLFVWNYIPSWRIVEGKVGPVMVLKTVSCRSQSSVTTVVNQFDVVSRLSMGSLEGMSCDVCVEYRLKSLLSAVEHCRTGMLCVYNWMFCMHSIYPEAYGR